MNYFSYLFPILNALINQLKFILLHKAQCNCIENVDIINYVKITISESTVYLYSDQIYKLNYSEEEVAPFISPSYFKQL